MTNQDEVFIDTSFFKALIDESDEFHQMAISIWEKLKKSEVALTTSNYIIDETATLLRSRLGMEVALKFRQSLINTRLVKVARVLLEDEAQAWEHFQQDWSRLSFTDCASFAQMRRLGIQAALSFDKHFAQAGFELVEGD